MRVETYYGADTEVEREAKKALAELRREYQERAKPYLNILANELAHKIPRHIIIPEEGDKLPMTATALAKIMDT